MTETSIRSVRWIRVSDIKSLSLFFLPIHHIFCETPSSAYTGRSYIFTLSWQSSLLIFFCQGEAKCFCRAHSFCLDKSTFRKACNALVASNPRDENELSLLRGSLIRFLHLFKLGYHPLGRFPAYSTRAKAISIAAISNFLLQGIWRQFCPHVHLSLWSHADLKIC